MAARRKPKQAAKAAKGKERVEPHFGGPKRATARKPRKSARRSTATGPIRRALLRGLYTTLALIALIIVGSFLYLPKGVSWVGWLGGFCDVDLDVERPDFWYPDIGCDELIVDSE